MEWFRVQMTNTKDSMDNDTFQHLPGVSVRIHLRNLKPHPNSRMQTAYTPKSMQKEVLPVVQAAESMARLMVQAFIFLMVQASLR